MLVDRLVVLVTGSSRGLGRVTIEGFARSGYDVVINYFKHEKEALELEKYISSTYNVRVMSICCDVSDEESVKRMVFDIVNKMGHIDILVNNASICNDSLLLDKDIDSFRRILDVNLIGTYLCSKYVGRVMLNEGYGKIINISSTNGIDTYYPESCDYDASKAGVVSLTHNFARELAPKVLVNCICPGWINTDMNKSLSEEQIKSEEEKILIKRFATAEEISNVIIFLASDKANYINDAIIRVDGGRYNG